MSFLFSLLLGYQSFAAVPVTETVGMVADYVITSREVQISTVADAILYPPKTKLTGLYETGPDSKDFRNHVATVLLEAVIANEAEAFNVAALSETDLAEAVGKIEKATNNKAYWNQLEVTPAELKRFTTRKLIAKSFLQFKTSSMTSIITDQEAQAYYEKNRVKFGSTPFASFKDNIKSFLAQQQLEERLRTWFEVVKRKYKVRNFL
ncbi:MAG: hypothetical protein J7501_14685 [Bdellovibrio sp.]|nr:hypothetical protein [Bdellovibrio sp.]